MLRATFLSTSLTFMIVYVWARRNPQVLMNFLGVFNFAAPFMPWVLLGFSLLLSGHLPVADLIGIGAGHAYFYLVDVFPLLYGWTPVKTPQMLKDLLNPPMEHIPAGPPGADADADGHPEDDEYHDRAPERTSPSPPMYEVIPQDDAAGVSPLNAPTTDDDEDSVHEAHSHKD